VTHVVESMPDASLDLIPCGTISFSANITSQFQLLQTLLLRGARGLLQPRACHNHTILAPARCSVG